MLLEKAGGINLALAALLLPLIQTAVDDGVVHGRAHGQPEAGQVDLLDVFPPVQLLIDGGEDEVDVIGQPADGKGHHNDDHHFYNLKRKISFFGKLKIHCM